MAPSSREAPASMTFWAGCPDVPLQLLLPSVLPLGPGPSVPGTDQGPSRLHVHLWVAEARGTLRLKKRPSWSILQGFRVSFHSTFIISSTVFWWCHLCCSAFCMFPPWEKLFHVGGGHNVSRLSVLQLFIYLSGTCQPTSGPEGNIGEPNRSQDRVNVHRFC